MWQGLKNWVTWRKWSFIKVFGGFGPVPLAEAFRLEVRLDGLGKVYLAPGRTFPKPPEGGSVWVALVGQEGGTVSHIDQTNPRNRVVITGSPRTMVTIEIWWSKYIKVTT